ncbi:oxidoreductase [candidate division WOR-3 bacterium 4484_100]|uniref:Oxidoreductase n=1 Tax=candidate division WOR-3 bacterium 4484_100 TaxID=1936077 RepID=A0A1V4QFG2_UNCW3|nr:MAG: oxidoreductase [candidate division WOR-3 bacterium 4484_100]
MAKPLVAFYWCASCGGCEEAVVDLAEDILNVADAVEFRLWPVAMDFKYKDIEAMPDKSIAVSCINGAIRTEEQEYLAKLLRQKSQLVVAFGSCAHLGGIPGLANVSNRAEIFETAYKLTPSTVNPEGIYPKTVTETPYGKLKLPEFFNTVKTLDQTVDVDYYIPGCAPPPDLILKAITAILENNLPPKGSVIASEKALCETCPRNESKPDKLVIKDIKRISMVKADPEKCFLAEGILCMGPATRGGCGERCINANMPCRGCFGPTKQVKDMGARFLSALASIIDIDDEEEIKKVADSVPDPIGLFYMYSLPSSILKRKKGG